MRNNLNSILHFADSTVHPMFATGINAKPKK
jgi:hypothetical protein